MRYVHKFNSISELNTVYENSELYEEPFIATVGDSTTPIFNRTVTGIDLGLPSGLLWGDCNLGANFPHESGYYLAWGETSPKEDYSLSTYTYYDNEDGYTKYFDTNSALLPEDDAATVILGGRWRLPTLYEFLELEHYCDHYHQPYTMINGVYGILFTSNITNNSIFLPRYGSMHGTELLYDDSFGRYWSSELYDIDHPYMFGWCDPSGNGVSCAMFDSENTRAIGCPVRPVWEPVNYVPYVPVN